MKRNNYRRRLRAIEISDIDDMDGLFFKDYVVKLLRQRGFTHIKVTQRSSESGVGLVAFKSNQRYRIQVERKSGKTSSQPKKHALTGKTFGLCNPSLAIRIAIYREKQTSVQPPMEVRPLIEANR